MNAQTVLTPLAVTAEPLLRAIAGAAFANRSELARQAGRNPTNMTRDLSAVAEAGLAAVDGQAITLTPAGVAALAAIDRANGTAEAQGADGIVGLLHAQMLPSTRNPRRDWDSPEAEAALTELAASIKAEGRVLQNLVVRPREPIGEWNIEGPNGRLPLFEIVAGERRWRAVGLLAAAGHWPHDKPVPALITDLDDAGHDRVALIENLKRRDLNHMEEARAFRSLIDGGMKTADLASAIGFTQRMVQQRLQLLDLSEADQLRIVRKDLSLEKARDILAGHPEDEERAAAVAPPTPAAIDLEPHQELALVEIQAAAAARPFTNAMGPTAPIEGDFILSEWPPEAALAELGFIYITGSHPRGVTLLKPAVAYLNRLVFSLATPETRLRCARQDAGLSDETIAELEEAEDFDRSYLNERNKPAKLAQADALVLLEIVDAAGQDQWRGAEVRPGLDDAHVKALEARELVRGPRDYDHRLYLAKTWSAEKALTRAHPGWEKKATRAKHVEELRVALLGDDASSIEKGRYATAWLNGPFPQRHDQLEQQKEEVVWRLEQEIAALDPVARFQRFGEVLALLGCPAPWIPHGNRFYGVAKAANGNVVDGNDELYRRVVRVAVNVAANADLTVLTAPASAERPMDRPTFVGWIAERLQELLPDWKAERCKAKAGHVLDDHLKDQGCVFGHDDYSWTKGDAEEIAELWAGSDTDPESEDDTTPAALEGVTQ